MAKGIKKRLSFSKNKAAAAPAPEPVAAPAVESVEEKGESKILPPAPAEKTEDIAPEVAEPAPEVAEPTVVETSAAEEADSTAEAVPIEASQGAPEAAPGLFGALKKKISFSKPNPAPVQEPVVAKEEETIAESGESKFLVAAEEVKEKAEEAPVAEPSEPVESEAFQEPSTAPVPTDEAAPAVEEVTEEAHVDETEHIVKKKPSLVGKLKKKISFSKEKAPTAPSAPAVEDLDAVTEKGESKFIPAAAPAEDVPAAATSEEVSSEPVVNAEEPSLKDDVEAVEDVKEAAVEEAPKEEEPAVAAPKETLFGQLKKKISFSSLPAAEVKSEEPAPPKLDDVKESPASKFVEAIPSTITTKTAEEAPAPPPKAEEEPQPEVTAPTEEPVVETTSVVAPAEPAVAPAPPVEEATKEAPATEPVTEEPAKEEESDKQAEDGEQAEPSGLTAVPAPFPASNLSKAPSAEEIAKRIREEIDRVPGLPGQGSSDDVSIESQSSENGEIETDPETGRPIPPVSSVPEEVHDEELLALLQCVPLMNGATQAAGKKPKKSKNARHGVFTDLETLNGLDFAFAKPDEAVPATEEAVHEDEDVDAVEEEEDLYSKVAGGGVMLYAPLVPEAGDVVELAKVEVLPSVDEVKKVEKKGHKSKSKSITNLWGILPWGGKKEKKVVEPTPEEPSEEVAVKEADSKEGEPSVSEVPAEEPTPTADADEGASTQPELVDAPVPAPARKLKKKKVVETKWIPSTEKMSFEATWWGYKLYIPPPVMAVLDDDQLEAVKKVSIITTALTWFFANIPITSIPTVLSPAVLVLKKIAPYISYIGAFIAWSWGEIKTFDTGHGVILSATWILPVAVIPGSWKAVDWPVTTAPAEPSTGTEPSPAVPADAPSAETPAPGGEPTSEAPAPSEPAKEEPSTDPTPTPSEPAKEVPPTEPAPAAPVETAPSEPTPAPTEPSTEEPAKESDETAPTEPVTDIPSAPVDSTPEGPVTSDPTKEEPTPASTEPVEATPIPETSTEEAKDSDAPVKDKKKKKSWW